MKNDILFRGIRQDNHEYVEGYYCKYPHKFSEFLNDYILVLEYDAETETAICMAYQVDSESVERFTGTNDRDNIKIFEGDIVSAYKNNDVLFTEVVTFRNGCFWFGNWSWIEFLNVFRNIKVIGNTYTS